MHGYDPRKVTPAGGLAGTGEYVPQTGIVLSDPAGQTADDNGETRPRGGAAAPTANIPGYEIVSELGRGGMGVVYLARQIALKRMVALKMILAAEHSSPAQLARFHAEAESIARLQHPNIVQIYEIGKHQGVPYFTLEYVEGGSLEAMLAGQPLHARQCAELVRTLALAVEYAHAAGVVHRDLKPGNVLLAVVSGSKALAGKPASEPGTAAASNPSMHSGTWPPSTVPKIADFGLAKQLDDESGQTQSGAILGSPRYMAPEQASGNTREVGPLTDVYALGAILYECLTGRPPFAAATVVQTLDQVRLQAPVPPRKLQMHVPRDLETICLKCLEKPPSRRYPSAAALAEDLSRYLRGEPIQARPIGTIERAWAWAKRRPAMAAAGVLMVLTVLFGIIGGGAVWLWQRAEHARTEAVAERGKADVERNKAENAEKEATAAKEREQALLDLNRVQLALREWSANDVSKARRVLAMCTKSTPTWEWAYVDNLTRPLMELPGHTLMQGSTTHLAVSPVGDRLATCDGARVVRLWNLETGKLIAVCAGTAPQIGKPGAPLPVTTDALPRRLAFTPDGTRLVGVRGIETAYFWNAGTGQLEDQLQPKGAFPVSAVAVRPGGKQLAVSYFGGPAFDNRVRLWDVEKQTETVLRGHDGEIYALSYNRDGSLLATASSDGTIRIWDVALTKELHALKVDRTATTQVSWGPGELLATLGTDGVARIWNAEAGKPRRVLQMPGVRMESVAFRPDGKQVATGMANGSIVIWDEERGEALFTLRGHLGAYSGVHLLAYTPDGSRLISASSEGVVRVWDATTPQELRKTQLGPQESGRTSAISADGRWIALSPEDKTITLWDAQAGKAAGVLKGHVNPPQAMSFSRDGKLLAAANGGDDTDIRIWDVAGLKVKRQLPVGGEQIWDVAFHPDGKRLVGGGEWDGGRKGEVRIWNLEGDGNPRSLMRFNSSVRRIALSRDGKTIAATDQVGVIKVREVDGDKELLIADQKQNGSCYALAFSPDGSVLAVADADGSVVVYDTHQWKVLERMPDELFYIALTFTPDGKRLAGTRGDGRVTIWDVTTRQEALNLGRPAHSSMGKSMVFVDEGRKLLAVDSSGLLRIFEAPAYGR